MEIKFKQIEIDTLGAYGIAMTLKYVLKNCATLTLKMIFNNKNCF